ATPSSSTSSPATRTECGATGPAVLMPPPREGVRRRCSCRLRGKEYVGGHRGRLAAGRDRALCRPATGSRPEKLAETFRCLAWLGRIGLAAEKPHDCEVGGHLGGSSR